ncbi:hypothetical protein T439DRAFT_348093, partial [Meredithblackwellia eburnea MCA 4105]
MAKADNHDSGTQFHNFSSPFPPLGTGPTFTFPSPPTTYPPGPSQTNLNNTSFPISQSTLPDFNSSIKTSIITSIITSTLTISPFVTTVFITTTMAPISPSGSSPTSTSLAAPLPASQNASRHLTPILLGSIIGSTFVLLSIITLSTLCYRRRKRRKIQRQRQAQYLATAETPQASHSLRLPHQISPLSIGVQGDFVNDTVLAFDDSIREIRGRERLEMAQAREMARSQQIGLGEVQVGGEQYRVGGSFRQTLHPVSIVDFSPPMRKEKSREESGSGGIKGLPPAISFLSTVVPTNLKPLSQPVPSTSTVSASSTSPVITTSTRIPFPTFRLPPSTSDTNVEGPELEFYPSNPASSEPSWSDSASNSSLNHFYNLKNIARDDIGLVEGGNGGLLVPELAPSHVDRTLSMGTQMVQPRFSTDGSAMLGRRSDEESEASVGSGITGSGSIPSSVAKEVGATRQVEEASHPPSPTRTRQRRWTFGD